MKRAAPHDAGDDDSNDRRHIPRVIRNALDGARERPPLVAGYGPAVPVQIALAHRWARYEDVVAALRSLGNLSLLEQAAREGARDTVRGLFQHPTPFDAVTRFPEAEVFLPVDHGKFGQCVSRIQKELLRVEAATRGYNWQRVHGGCERRGRDGEAGVAGGAREAGAVRPGCFRRGLPPDLDRRVNTE
ncbi:unnamed protein product [Urochloa humidicola]